MDNSVYKCVDKYALDVDNYMVFGTWCSYPHFHPQVLVSYAQGLWITL